MDDTSEILTPGPKSESPNPLEYKITRRTALKLIGALFTEIATSRALAAHADSTKIPHKEDPELDIELVKKDIISYRKKLGLTGLPEDFLEAEKLNNIEWKNNGPETRNNLPESMKSYGEYAKYVLEQIYGHNNLTAFLESIEFVDSYFVGAGYNPIDKTNFYGLGVLKTDLPTFLGYILHESAGHAFDPKRRLSHFKNIPFDAYARMTRGRWKMLSQALSVPDQFFKHPDDLTYPRLIRCTGEEAARHIVLGEPSISEICESQDTAKLLNILYDLQKKYRSPDGHVYFNNKVSAEFGRMITDAGIRLSGKTKEIYELFFEISLKEIYAEMVKYIFIEPEVLKGNPDIISGFAEIVSAIRGEPVSAGDIADIDLSLPEEINKRWQNEKRSVNSEFAGAIKDQIRIFDEKKMAYEKFYNGDSEFHNLIFTNLSDYPLHFDISQETKNNIAVLQRYLVHCNNMYGTFKDKLYDTTYQFLTPQFDPENMYAWDIRDLLAAIDTSLIQNLVYEISSIAERFDLSKFDWDVIKRNLDLLERFVNSPGSGVKPRLLG